MGPSALRKILLSAVVAVGCGGGAAGSAEPATTPEPAAGPMNVSALVENQNEFDAVIYAYRSGRWTRLGVVVAGGTRRLPFTWDRPEVRFVIELLHNDVRTDVAADEDMRKTFAADVHGTVPCHLTATTAVEPNLTLMLLVQPALAKNQGGGRCQRRPGG